MTEPVTPIEKPEVPQEVKDAMGISNDAQTIKDVEEMGNIVTNWHFNVVTDLHHKLRMPDDVGIDIPTGDLNEDGTDVVIDGNADHKAGFLAGISYALEKLDTFPVKGVPEDDAQDQA